MSKLKLLAATLLLLLSLPMTAQTKKDFTLDDLMWGGSNYWNLQPKSLSVTFWGDRLVEQDVEQVSLYTDEKGRKPKKAETLFTLDELNKALADAKTEKARTLQYAGFPYADQPLALIRLPRATVLYDFKQKAVAWQGKRTEGCRHEEFCAASKHTAYVKDWNLYVRTADGSEHQISTDGTRQLQYGLSVHRDEFGIHKGTFWSPSGNSLAFYRMDQSMVTDFPLVDNATRVATLAPEAYPMAGMTSHKVTVGVYNAAKQTTVYLKAGDPTDRYFTNLAWSPDESTIYLFELPRTQDKAELVAYDAATGERRGVIYTETNARYVEPMQPITFLPWDASKFIMQSRRDGFNHLYLFTADGRLVKQLTKGRFEVIDFLGFNEKTKSVIYKANAESPVCHNHYALAINASADRTATPLLLDNGRGTHNGRLSASGALLLDRWSAHDVFRSTDLLTTASKGRKAAAPAVLQADASPWTDFNVPTVESGTIKAADGTTDLYYRLVKPHDFNPARKYPTVVYVYGGPHANNVQDSWMYWMRPWEAYMAQKGYLIFVVDNRGSQYRGFEFEACTHRRLGEIEMADQMAGVNFLKSLPYVDAERLGVHGWSFGGFMTTNLMCSYPDVFKAGVAGGPVIDWKFYEVMYGERYMDTPQENPEGYAASDLTRKAGKLKGRLQIIVGYNDPTCVLQHSLSFLRACADAGTQPDYFVYPGQGHNMSGRDMVHLHERITRYFDDYLK